MRNLNFPIRLSRPTKNRLLRRCAKFIGIPSTNPRGNIPLAREVAQGLKKLGFRVRFQKARLQGSPQVNLLARIGPAKGRPFLLNTHLDTVTTDPQGWTKTGRNPFRATLQGGRLFGLGSADTKLALACQITALEELLPMKLKRPLMITGTYGEEVGLIGVQRLIRHPWIKAGDVLNSEPTELKPVNGNQGFRVYHLEGKGSSFERKDGFLLEIHFKGRAAHSAYPAHGMNAITKAFGWLRNQEGRIQVLSMDGGLAPNIVAPGCTLRVLSPHPEPSSLPRFGGRIVAQKIVTAVKIWPGLPRFLSRLVGFYETLRSEGESFNLGIVRADEKRIELILDHRFSPRRDPQISFKRWKRFVGAGGRSGWGSFHLILEKDNPHWYGGKSGRWLREVQAVLKGMSRKETPVLKLGCTEAGFFAKKGCDVVTFGPGRAHGNAHQPNESVPLKELEDAFRFYRELIVRTCG